MGVGPEVNDEIERVLVRIEISFALHSRVISLKNIVPTRFPFKTGLRIAFFPF